MRVVGLDRRLDLGEIERAVGPVRDHLRLDGAENGQPARFVAVTVRLAAQDYLLAALAMAHQRREVRLRAGREQQRRLEAEQLGGLGLQLVYRRIVAEDVVAELGVVHRPAHPGRGPGHRVGAQIDDAAGLFHQRYSRSLRGSQIGF